MPRSRLLRPLLLSCCLLLLALPAAQAAQLQGSDPKNNIAFQLQGPQLQLLAPSAPQQALQLQAACFAGLVDFTGYTGSLSDNKPWNPASSFFAVVSKRLTWAAGSTTASVQFSQDISAQADGCLLEQADGSDFAAAGFTEAGKTLLTGQDNPVDARAKAALEIAYQAARAVAAVRKGSYPAPTTLARMIHKLEPALRTAVASKLARVTRSGTVYVLASSTSKRLRLAYRTTAGDVWLLAETKSGQVQVRKTK